MLGNTITKFMSCLVLNFQNYLNKSKFFYLEKRDIVHTYFVIANTQIRNLEKNHLRTCLHLGFCSHFFLAREFLKST